MVGEIKIAGIFGLIGLIGYFGYNLYEKNQILSIILLLIFIVLAGYVIISEINFKRIRHKGPWNFEKYKGE